MIQPHINADITIVHENGSGTITSLLTRKTCQMTPDSGVRSTKQMGTSNAVTAASASNLMDLTSTSS